MCAFSSQKKVNFCKNILTQTFLKNLEAENVLRDWFIDLFKLLKILYSFAGFV